MTDDQLDHQIRELARAHNRPPDTPREEIWRAIAARRVSDPDPTRRVEPNRPPTRRVVPGWIPWAAAAAVTLAVGIGIGRVSLSPDQPVVGAAADAAARVNPTAYRLVAQEHLAQSETFLTLFRSSLARPGDHRLASATARQLLAGNRLLLDSPAADDRRTRLLLEDLELVLAEIAQLSPRSLTEDLELIREGIERGDVLPRLRIAVPAGAAPTQGVL